MSECSDESVCVATSVQQEAPLPADVEALWSTFYL